MTTQGHRHRGTRPRLFALALLIGAALALVASAMGPRLGLGNTVVPAALVVFALTMACAATGLPEGHPYPTLGPAMWVTSVRAGLVSIVAAMAVEPPTSLVATCIVWVASVAASLDGLDGWLARRTRMSSAFGARFDMEVDAFLILILGFLVWRHERAGAWIILSGVLRYLFVAMGWIVPWFTRSLPPSQRRKGACVIQIVGLIIAMSPLVPRLVSAPVALVSLVVLVWSFAIDTAWLWDARGRPLAAERA